MNQSEPHICDMYILYCRNVSRITGDITHHVCGIINDNKTKKTIGAKICSKLWTLSVTTEAAREALLSSHLKILDNLVKLYDHPPTSGIVDDERVAIKLFLSGNPIH